jgi:hypothetical protein
MKLEGCGVVVDDIVVIPPCIPLIGGWSVETKWHNHLITTTPTINSARSSYYNRMHESFRCWSLASIKIT